MRAAAVDLTDLRLGMLAQGYHPVPVLRFDAKDKAAGKRPTLAEWQTVCEAADETEIRRWARDSGQRNCLNTGLLCGSVVGLDLDIPDYALARRINALADAMLPPTPLIRIGKSPKSLRAFRAEHVHAKASTPALFLPDGTKIQVEALGKGNQFVSFGTHPDTKLPYAWPHQSPLDVRFEDMPVLPDATLRAFLVAAEAGMREAGGRTEAEIKEAAEGKAKPAPSAQKKPRPTRSNDFPPPTYDDVKEALAAVPNRHDWQGWVKIGAAIYDALADDGEDLFTAWSEQSARNDPDATRRKWKSFSRSKMNISDSTLFWEARQAGWKPQWERKRDEAAAQADTANGATPPIATAGNGPASDPPEHDGSDGDGSAHEDPPPPEIDDPGYAYAQAHAADATLDPVRALVAEFNIKYMVVNEGGKILLYAPMHDPILNRRYHHRMDFADLQRAYMNRSVKVGDKFQPAAAVWLRHRERRQYIRGITFAPSGHDDPEVLNLWQGFAVLPQPGRWDLMKSHIFEVICSSSREHYDYLMDWMARLIQFPAQQGEVSIVLMGIEGTGKGLLARALLYILGQHGLAINHAKHLTGNFNAHLRDCVFLFADEAFYAGDKAHVGVLKALITEPTLTIEAKYANAVQAGRPAAIAARRFLVLLTADTKVGNRPYFTAIQHQMENGGYEAMLGELLHRDLTLFNVRDVPDSVGLQEQKKLSLPTPEAWWMDTLHRGFVWKSKLGLEDYFGEWHDVVTTEVLFASYTEFAKAKNERHRMAREAFGAFMGCMGATPAKPRNAVVGEHTADVTVNQYGDTKRMAALIKQDRAHGYHLGSLGQARDAFCDTTKLTIEWPADGGDEEIP